MLQTLSDKLQRAFKNLRGHGSLTEDNVKDGLKEIRVALLEADVHFKVVKQLLARIRSKALGQEVLTALSPAEHLIRIVRDELVSILGGKAIRLRRSSTPPSVYFVVGLQGSGKTTSTGKLARWMSKHGRKPLLVSVDVRRPAAREQLAVVGRQVSQPVYPGQPGETTPLELARGAVREAQQVGRDAVLVDTAGRLHVDDELMEELVELRQELLPVEVLFVADAMTGQDAVTSATEFHRRLSVTGLVLTKMDGDARGGAALSIREVTGCPIKFLGTGEKPRNFEVFHPDRVVSRLLGHGDLATLLEVADDRLDKKAAKSVQERLLAKRFTLEDYLQQLRQVRRLGSLRSLTSMMPTAGPLAALGQMPEEQVDPKMLGRSEAILSSMTPDERRRPEVLNASRRRRIALGSGTSIQQVNSLLKEFRQVRKMAFGLAETAGVGGRRRRKKSKRRRRRRKSRKYRAARRAASPAPASLGRLLGR